MLQISFAIKECLNMAGDLATVSLLTTQTEEIKVPGVICRQSVQEFGDVLIPAPAGITFDTTSGQLQQVVRLEMAGNPQLRSVVVLPGKVINMGVVPARLLVNEQVVLQLFEVPFQAVIECPGAQPGDLVQKHDFQVEGFALAPIRLPETGSPTLSLHLMIKVVVQFCLVVARETIFRVEAAKPFC
jgi:hypothetical protein